MTCMKALMYRWIGNVVGGKVEQYVQLHTTDPDKEGCLKYERHGDSFPTSEQLFNLAKQNRLM